MVGKQPAQNADPSLTHLCHLSCNHRRLMLRCSHDAAAAAYTVMCRHSPRTSASPAARRSPLRP